MKIADQKKVCVVIVAAGKGKRMKKTINKMYLKIGGIPILYRTIYQIASMERVTEVIVVIGEDDEDQFNFMMAAHGWIDKIANVIYGGKERSDSVRNALRVAMEKNNIDVVMVHDGARPFISKTLMNRILNKTAVKQIVVPFQPVRDTIRKVKDGRPTEVVDREKLVLIQTPQAFFKEDIKACYFNEKNESGRYTDDAAYFEEAHYEICLVEGERWNIKITDQNDLDLAECLLQFFEEINNT